MIGKLGIVSVTFRKKTPEEIIALCTDNGLETIEWGGDVHVPPDDPTRAREIGRKTREAGLQVISYGSYYAPGRETQPYSFTQNLDAALALEAKNIRLWAGPCGSAECDDALYARVAEETRCIADLCAKEGVTVSFEYHGGTLTDSAEQAVRWMQTIDHPNCYLYWQPNPLLSVSQNCDAMQKIAPWLSNLHVFHWMQDAADQPATRYLLQEGESSWQPYLQLLDDDKVHHMQLEFVKDDADASFAADCKTLLRWRQHPFKEA